MPKGKRLAALLLSAAILFTLTACQSRQPQQEPESANQTPVGESPVAMKTVTQDSQDGYVTYTFEIPEDWVTSAEGAFAVSGADQSNPDLERPEDILIYSHAVQIVNYYHDSLTPSQEEQKAYQSLFAGDPQPYREMLETMFAIDNEISQEYLGVTLQMTDFSCSYYQGRNGTLILVRDTVAYGTVSSTEVRCFREDIPQYMVVGMDNDQLELSSGEIALYVMDSLQVEEHFTVDNGIIHKEGE